MGQAELSADKLLIRPASGRSRSASRERGLQARIPAPAPHDLRRTWIGDLLDLGVDLATVQKMAGHASASTTAGYDRRDRGPQYRAAALLHVPYMAPGNSSST